MANLDLKQLSKIIDLCRKKGVESIEVEGVKVVLGSAPVARKRQAQFSSEDDVQAEDLFDEAQTLFWSSTGSLPLEGAS